jgi:DNA-directed RNA polymerase III subunit RPC4
MTASGPFAMGPAMSGSSARRSAPRSNFAPIVPLPGGPSGSNANLTGGAGPSLVKREPGDENAIVKKEEHLGVLDDEAEVYSDPDEGVEIVDMDDVRRMDWMAPESLKREKEGKKKKKKRSDTVKKEEQDSGMLFIKFLCYIQPSPKTALGIVVNIPEAQPSTAATAEGEGVNLANAVDLSESEDEEELEDLIDDFALHAEVMDVCMIFELGPCYLPGRPLNPLHISYV